MEKVKKDLLIDLFNVDSARTPKNKPTNDLMIEMLENSNIEAFAVSPTRSNRLYNRGDIAEINTKSIILEYCGYDFQDIEKSLQRQSDLDTSKIALELLKDLGLPKSVNIEFKLTTSIANASIKNNKARYCVIINLCKKYGIGAYLVMSKNLIKDKHDHITPESVLNGERLDLLSELLGLFE